MNYIVNPSVFYLISVLDGLDTVCLIAGACLLAILSWFMLSYMELDKDFYDNEDEYLLDKKNMKRRITIVATIFALTVISCILIPSRRDMEKMLIASYAIEDNITAATNYGKDLVDYIFERVEKNK